MKNKINLLFKVNLIYLLLKIVLNLIFFKNKIVLIAFTEHDMFYFPTAFACLLFLFIVTHKE